MFHFFFTYYCTNYHCNELLRKSFVTSWCPYQCPVAFPRWFFSFKLLVLYLAIKAKKSRQSSHDDDTPRSSSRLLTNNTWTYFSVALFFASSYPSGTLGFKLCLERERGRILFWIFQPEKCTFALNRYILVLLFKNKNCLLLSILFQIKMRFYIGRGSSFYLFS